MNRVSVRTRTLLALLLATGGAALNMLPEPFVTQGVAIFGLGAAVLAALLLPYTLAIPVTLIVCAPVWYRFSDWTVIALLTFLPLLISGLCYRRDFFRSLVVGCVWWSCLAIPVLLVYYNYMYPEDWVVQVASSLVTWLSGMFAVLSGHFAYTGIMVQRPKYLTQQISAHALLGYLFSGVFFLAVLGVIYIYVSAFQREKEEQIYQYMRQRVDVMSEQLDSFLSTHHTAIKEAADLLSSPNKDGSLSEINTDNVLAMLGRHYPQFITFLSTDNSGKLTHAFPWELLQKSQDNGFPSVHERDYFSEVKRTNRAYVSNAFQGRGFGNDPIVAMSAPIRDAKGQFVGIVEGSLSLRSFLRFDRQNLSGFAMLIEDRDGKVVFASQQLSASALNRLTPELCESAHCLGQYRYLGKEWLIERAKLDSLGWQVSLFYDFSDFVISTSDYLMMALGLLLLLTLFGIAVGQGVASLFARPMRDLMNHFADFDPSRKQTRYIQHQSRLYIKEVSALDYEFVNLQLRLIRAFNELEAAREEQQRLNIELGHLNASLETRIEEKTHSLAKALDEAKAASFAKSQFLANMSHEIRTPMNGIIGSCENLLDRPIDKDIAKRISIIIESAANLLLILDSILDWSKIEAGKMRLEYQPMSVSRVLEACHQLHNQSSMRKGVAIEYKWLTPAPEVVFGDAGKLSQIINNLLSNAVKFTESGTILLFASYEDSRFTLTVQDTGIGIAFDKQRAIFEQFEQADLSTTRNFGGTGLGLSITKKLLDLMNGDITVDSEPGKGTRFTITMPMLESDQPLADNNEAMPTLPQGLRVLLVEDNDINAQIVVDMLSKENVTCLRVRNGEVALQALERHHFDVILMDCMMPVMDGFEATRRIRKLDNDKASVPIVALTANAFSDDRDACIAAGMDAHLSKPIRKRKLFDALAHYAPASKAKQTL